MRRAAACIRRRSTRRFAGRWQQGRRRSWRWIAMAPEETTPSTPSCRTSCTRRSRVAHHPWGRYTELLEQGCDAALMVGMHARNNTPDGVMCHTISTVRWRNLWFGDDLVGETGVNAALCGHYGCPVALVTGDEAVVREAREILGDGFTGVAVKRGLSRYSARQIPPVRARQMIEDGAKQALTQLSGLTVYQPARPATITIDVDTVDQVNSFKGRHGVEIEEPLKVVSRAEDWMTAWDQVWHW